MINKIPFRSAKSKMMLRAKIEPCAKTGLNVPIYTQSYKSIRRLLAYNVPKRGIFCVWIYRSPLETYKGFSEKLTIRNGKIIKFATLPWSAGQ